MFLSAAGRVKGWVANTWRGRPRIAWPRRGTQPADFVIMQRNQEIASAGHALTHRAFAMGYASGQLQRGAIEFTRQRPQGRTAVAP